MRVNPPGFLIPGNKALSFSEKDDDPSNANKQALYTFCPLSSVALKKLSSLYVIILVI